MKKVRLIALLSLMILPTSCNNIDKGDFIMQIYVASDLHYLSNNLVEGNNKYTKDVLTADGRVQEYDYEIVNSFVNDINKNKPQYAFITGDLTFNGEKESHLELVKILNQVSGTKILVIPGNHDYNNLNSSSYVNDVVSPTPTINEEEFRKIYSDYGYTDALSYDETTLSYIYPLNDNTWALMLDVTLAKYNYEFDMNLIGGQVFDETYLWLEEKLSYAQKNNITVLSFTHQNLLTHNPLFEKMFTIYDNQKIVDLFAKYDVILNFSGHLHIQNIQKTKVNKKEIYDIASESLLDYGNKYGVLNIYRNAYEYSCNKITLNNVDLSEYSFNVFYQKYYKKQINSNKNNYPKEYEKLTDLEAKLNTYYFSGEYEQIHKIYRENRALLKKVSRSDKKKYLHEIINVENKNQDSLLIVK